jgi:quinol monooxygenase YgiN
LEFDAELLARFGICPDKFGQWPVVAPSGEVSLREVAPLPTMRIAGMLLPHPTRSNAMTDFNAVRFRVKPGRDQEFLDAHKKIVANWPGLQHVNMIKTGNGNYCLIAEWTDMKALAAARPNMIATLDTFRATLEDLGAGLGVTDPVSGPVVLALK